MAAANGKVALITGANRGIGYETAKDLGLQGITVILGVRDIESGQEAANKLQGLGIDAAVVHYDAAKPETAGLVAEYIKQHFGKLDILVNNAGVLKENLIGVNNSSTVSSTVLHETFEINLFAVIELTQKLLPLIKLASAGRIVNLSSILASLTLHSMADSPIEPAKGFAYNASKTALNAYTVHLAHELKNTNIKINAAHPGWVKTQLGGEHAPMEVEDSSKTSVRLATLNQDGESGGFFHENDALPW
ncbi:SDR family oxidoreductase [Methylobacillus caricis]|uniref:SDR family oxidoreductase n=1 Tax=Methylobacillus caricis TaxID=1971611 RepID=UPI001CFF7839|nr:SDR family oxidoreductase [Methylobacillus caricis]MCB5186503.1 SDR family oxidoreductase [Methylobacillus caricis]